MKHTLKKPCEECPFRRKSLPGWLGADTPEGFAATTMADVPMPCHKAIDYEDKDWEENQLPDAPYCYGALTLFANTCKLSRDRDRPRVASDHDNVFSNARDFVAHHKSLEKATPTLENLLLALNHAGFDVVDSGEDRYVPPEIRKAMGDAAGPPRCYAIVQFKDGKVINRTEEVFNVVVKAVGRGPFEFQTDTPPGREYTTVTVAVTRRFKEDG